VWVIFEPGGEIQIG